MRFVESENAGEGTSRPLILPAKHAKNAKGRGDGISPCTFVICFSKRERRDVRIAFIRCTKRTLRRRSSPSPFSEKGEGDNRRVVEKFSGAARAYREDQAENGSYLTHSAAKSQPSASKIVRD